MHKLRFLRLSLLVCSVVAAFAVSVAGQQKAEQSNMSLVGYNDLQGRSGYQIVVQQQGTRWIAYVGSQADKSPRPNPLTGKDEPSGTSIIDVTDPKNPKYIAHIPGELIQDEGGADFVRACSGRDLPHADKTKFYLMRNFGQLQLETWDVTDPAKPARLSVVTSFGDRPHDIHKSWWECDGGIAYVIAGPLDWPARPKISHNDAGEHALIYDLSDPAKPVFVRSFGLPGQQPGSSLPQPRGGMHGVTSTGPTGNRVYFSNSNDGDGVVEIVDRQKLLSGSKEPTDESLLYPLVGRIDLPADMGAEMSYPMQQMQLPEFAKQKEGSVKDFLAIVGEGHTIGMECNENRQLLRLFDITSPAMSVGVSTWTVPEASGNFCSRGGSFGTQSTNQSYAPIYYQRILFVAHFNAGVRAVDIRDPYNPREIGYYIPAVTARTEPSCHGDGAQQHCASVIQTDNVEVDGRGYVYIVDRNYTGLHILELTGPARKIADFNKAAARASGQ